MRSLNGEDPTAYVMSANVHRRHLTKSQRAIAVAMMFPEAKVGKPSEDQSAISSKIEGILGKVGAYVSMARTVLKFTPEAVPNLKLL